MRLPPLSSSGQFAVGSPHCLASARTTISPEFHVKHLAVLASLLSLAAPTAARADPAAKKTPAPAAAHKSAVAAPAASVTPAAPATTLMLRGICAAEGTACWGWFNGTKFLGPAGCGAAPLCKASASIPDVPKRAR